MTMHISYKWIWDDIYTVKRSFVSKRTDLVERGRFLCFAILLFSLVFRNSGNVDMMAQVDSATLAFLFCTIRLK
jgi:hypothetical protein